MTGINVQAQRIMFLVATVRAGRTITGSTMGGSKHRHRSRSYSAADLDDNSHHRTITETNVIGQDRTRMETATATEVATVRRDPNRHPLMAAAVITEITIVSPDPNRSYRMIVVPIHMLPKVLRKDTITKMNTAITGNQKMIVTTQRARMMTQKERVQRKNKKEKLEKDAKRTTVTMCPRKRSLKASQRPRIKKGTHQEDKEVGSRQKGSQNARDY
jgi:hypothetical protein